MLNAISKFKIHQNLLKYWFTLRHFAMDDPVVVLEKKKKKRSKPSDKPGRFLLHDFFQRKVNFPPLCDALRFSFLAVVSTVNDFLFFRNSDRNFNRDSSKYFQNSIAICISDRSILKVLNDVFSANKCLSFCFQKQMAMNPGKIQIRKATE